jgi:hypothetical protein
MLRRQFLGQLKSVVEELAKLPTGRSLILVSDGFSLQPAREFYAVVASFLPRDSRFKMAGPTDLESNLQAAIKVAVERNVGIYSVDSRGLAQGSFASDRSMDASSPADSSPQSNIGRGPPSNRGGTLLSDMNHEANSVAFQNGSGMAQLAHATGGIYFHDSNDMLKQFRSALRMAENTTCSPTSRRIGCKTVNFGKSRWKWRERKCTCARSPDTGRRALKN